MKKYLTKFLFLLVLILPSFTFAAWNQTNSGSKYWYSIASSSDGTKLAAIAFNGYVYTSNDSGVTWIAKTNSGSRNWGAITSSSDGTKLAAIVSGGYIYTSTDSGATWTEQINSGIKNWSSIASSSDGTKLIASVYTGYLYTSVDGGSTWTQRGYNRDWLTVASSSDGTKLVAGIMGGYLYTSNDSGATWTSRISGYWSSVASSSDGTKLAASNRSNYIYTSTDSGVTWTTQYNSNTRNWYSIASSSDGTKLAAAVFGDYIYTSTDGGVNWIQQTNSNTRNWYSIASSSDGTKLAATVSNGYIYTYAPDDTTPDQFSFTDKTDQNMSSVIESDTITISGINTSVPISISSCTGGSCEYSINGGAYTNSSGTVSNTNTVKVRQVSSSSANTTTNLVLNIGGAIDTFSVTTVNDNTAPITSDNIDSSWSKNSVTVTLSCSDDNTGCVNTYYTTDGTIPTTSSTSGTTINLSASGIYTIKYFSVDAVGNTESVKTASNTVKIDKELPSKPVISNITTPTKLISQSWSWIDPVDSFSGVDSYEWRITGTHSSNGSVSSNYLTTSLGEGSYSLYVKAVDVAGNESEESNPMSLVVDTTSPIITLIGENLISLTTGDSYKEFGASALDDIDGDISSNIIINSSNVNTNNAGDYVVTYNVNDSAGNSAIQLTRNVKVNKRISSSGSTASSIYTNLISMGKIDQAQVIKNNFINTNSPSTTPSFTSKIIKFKTVSNDVKKLQQYLNSHGFTVSSSGYGSIGKETNYFGLATKNALMAFQRANNLVPDGILGPKTISAMK